MAVSQHDPKYLRAIVDMGSNGIRFSISSLEPSTARIMPTLYQHRAGISLYDAQYSASGEAQPIDDETIKAVLLAYRQFARTCEDFRVPKENCTVLATEATRTAINSEDFRRQIKEAVGWEVTMMPKELEGEVGAMGIASSLPDVEGLVMDLGGGSTQLSWLTTNLGKTKVRMPEGGAVSLPYGAAAMSRRLAEAEKKGSVEKLRQEIKTALRKAYDSLKVPNQLSSLSEEQGGFTLYLSGGGFRGWGYVLMSKHRVQPYPIPVINGFKAAREQFMDTAEVKEAAAATLQNEDDNIFRVSDRRASQVPAVAFLINALAEALPQIKEVRFCQGGVREGYLFKSLSADMQSLHPLVVATSVFSPTPSSSLIPQLLRSALPEGRLTVTAQDDYVAVFTHDLLLGFANLMFYHSTHSKDLQTSAALRATTSGVLAGVHGVLHESRMLLALLLCARWGGDVPPTDQAFKKRLEELVGSPRTLWWINYLGAVAGLIAAVFPAGASGDDKPKRMALTSSWITDGKGKAALEVKVYLSDDMDKKIFEKEIEDVAKVGKKKRWVGGRDGSGYKVVVETLPLK